MLKLKIFISYARNDGSEAAQRLHNDLKRSEVFVPWMDTKDLRQGKFKPQLFRQIVTADVVLVLLSPRSVQSEYVAWEWRNARRLRKAVIPLRIADCTIPQGLSDLQCFEFPQADESRRKEALEQLETNLLREWERKHRWRWIFRSVILILSIVLALSVYSYLTRNHNKPTPERVSPLQVASEALDIPTGTFADAPAGLVIAPSQSGTALWGYSATQAILFALDPTTGVQVSIWASDDAAEDTRIFALRDYFGAGFRPGKLIFDGAWLWITDTTGQQVIALDPLSLDLRAQWALDGIPVDIVTLGDTVWVAVHDTGQVVAGRIDRTAGAVAQECAVTVPGEVPGALAVEGRAAVWVAYGRGEGSALHAISPVGCRLSGEPIRLPSPAIQMVVSGSQLWAVLQDQQLMRVHLDGARVAELVDLVNAQVVGITDTEEQVWVLETQQPGLILLDPATDDEILRLPLDSLPTAMAQFGAQTWLATADDLITRYIVPEYVHPGVVDMVWADDTFWLIDQAGKLCHLRGPVPDCKPLAITGASQALSAVSGAASPALWLATDDGTVWRIALANRAAEAVITLDRSATTLADDGEWLWAANASNGLLAVIDKDDGSVYDDLEFSGAPPDVITYDGATVWFGYGGARQEVKPVRFDAERERAVELLPVIRLIQPLADLVADGEQLYVASSGQVLVIDPTSGALSGPIGAAQQLTVLAYDDEYLWGVNGRNGFIYRIWRRDEIR